MPDAAVLVNKYDLSQTGPVSCEAPEAADELG